MNDHEHVIKHLELIQGVVNRLGGNSFLLKGWSMTVLVGGSLLMVRMRSEQPLVALTLLVPVSWILAVGRILPMAGEVVPSRVRSGASTR